MCDTGFCADAVRPDSAAGLREWRERIGERLMLLMTCNHGLDYFGSGAVCKTCFANTQRIGTVIERERREAASIGWDAAVAALKYEDGTPVDVVTMVNPYRVTAPGATAP